MQTAFVAVTPNIIPSPSLPLTAAHGNARNPKPQNWSGARGNHTVTCAVAFGAVSLAATARRKAPALGRTSLPRHARVTTQRELAELVDKSAPEGEPSVAARPLERLMRTPALPFLPEPRYREFIRNVPGDAGFDPLGLAGDGPASFVSMFEAELKHGRIAMVAGVGFVAPELLHERLAELTGLPNLLAHGRTPTLLNGGLEADSILMSASGIIFGVMAFADVMVPRLTGVPGYYGFDPLNLGNIEPPPFTRWLLQKDTEWVAEAEVKHGRVAMLAVTFMVFREYLTGTPIWHFD